MLSTQLAVLLLELSPEPLAPEARIMPLDQAAKMHCLPNMYINQKSSKANMLKSRIGKSAKGVATKKRGGLGNLWGLRVESSPEGKYAEIQVWAKPSPDSGPDT